MKSAVTESMLLSTRDLPRLETDYLQALNLIHKQRPFYIQIKQTRYIWSWQYPIVKSACTSLTLQGENCEYQLYLGRCRLMNDSRQIVSWSDYEEDVACILFSAIHDDLISILEQSLDDRLSVTGVKSGSFDIETVKQSQADSGSPELGFSITDQMSPCLVEGRINLPASQLSRLCKLPRPAQQSNHNNLPDIVIKLPLIIDSLDFTHADLESFAVNSVIRLQNSSLLENNPHVVLALGSRRLQAQISGTRGEINFKTNNVMHADDIQAQGINHDITQC